MALLLIEFIWLLILHLATAQVSVTRVGHTKEFLIRNIPHWVNRINADALPIKPGSEIIWYLPAKNAKPRGFYKLLDVDEYKHGENPWDTKLRFFQTNWRGAPTNPRVERAVSRDNLQRYIHLKRAYPWGPNSDFVPYTFQKIIRNPTYGFEQPPTTVSTDIQPVIAPIEPDPVPITPPKTVSTGTQPDPPPPPSEVHITRVGHSKELRIQHIPHWPANRPNGLLIRPMIDIVWYLHGPGLPAGFYKLLDISAYLPNERMDSLKLTFLATTDEGNAIKPRTERTVTGYMFRKIIGLKQGYPLYRQSSDLIPKAFGLRARRFEQPSKTASIGIQTDHDMSDRIIAPVSQPRPFIYTPNSPQHGTGNAVNREHSLPSSSLLVPLPDSSWNFKYNFVDSFVDKSRQTVYEFKRESSRSGTDTAGILISKKEFDAGVKDGSISRFEIGRSVSKEAQQEYLNDAGYGEYDYNYDSGNDDNSKNFDKRIALREMKMMRKYLHSIQKRK